jgi:hypothetical protein
MKKYKQNIHTTKGRGNHQANKEKGGGNPTCLSPSNRKACRQQHVATASAFLIEVKNPKQIKKITSCL